MSEEPHSVIDVQADNRRRLTTLEIAVAHLAATEASHHANLALRVDRVEERLGRMERRLDLVSV